MRRSKALRWASIILGSVLLSACLVGKDKTQNYTISLPSKLPTYASGHYINFSYELYSLSSNSSVSQSTQGGIGMTWTLSSLELPFGLGLRTPVLLHQVKETNFEGERFSMQYITQNSGGSVLLNAFKGITTSSGYWPDSNGVLAIPDDPETKTVFASPIDTGVAGGSLVGVPQHSSNALDFDVMGNCTSSACEKVAHFTFSDYTIKSIDKITTPLGTMEAYKLHYSGVMTPSIVISETAYFDYRVSCGARDNSAVVNFEGDVWIYPPIGSVKLRNSCQSGSRIVNYLANITSTNLPH